MGLLKDKDKEQLQGVFAGLPNGVKIVFFTQENECEYCATTHELLEEVANLSDKIDLDVHDFVADAELAKQYGIDKIPAIALVGEGDTGVRFYGVPAGYEFATLIEDIVDLAKRDPGLDPAIAQKVAALTEPVHIQVMVSPTCPYCPAAVRTAHQMAMASDKITADMVEVSEFPHVAVKYNVQGVPKTVINEKFDLTGAQPASAVLQKIEEALAG